MAKVANTPERSYPRAPQIEANPEEAEQYIASLVNENADLIKALKSIVERGDANGMQNWPIIKQARAAVAKATGA